MKRTSWIMLGLLIILGVVAYFSQGEKKNYLEGAQLAVENTSEIYKVFLADRHKKRVVLTRESGGWIINNNFRARDNAIKLLLETFERIRVQSFVAKAAEKNVLQEIRDMGIKVELYNKEDKLIKTYYVGGGSPNQKGTYMMQEGDNHIYVAHIRNWEGILTPRFMLNAEDWRDKTVFSYAMESIKEVTVEYPHKPEASFKLEKKSKDDYAVYPLVVEQNFVKDRPEPVKGKVLYFLKGFEKQVAEAFETNNVKRDSIVQLTPFCTINVVDDQGKSKNVKLFPIPGRETGTLPDGSPRRAPVERYYASIDNNKEFMLVQHLLFKRLLPPYQFFFSEEGTPPEG